MHSKCRSRTGHAGTFFCSCDLDLDPTTLIYMNLTWMKMYSKPEINFLGQGVQKLEHYRQTHRHRQTRLTTLPRHIRGWSEFCPVTGVLGPPGHLNCTSVQYTNVERCCHSLDDKRSMKLMSRHDVKNLPSTTTRRAGVSSKSRHQSDETTTTSTTCFRFALGRRACVYIATGARGPPIGVDKRI